MRRSVASGLAPAVSGAVGGGAEGSNGMDGSGGGGGGINSDGYARPGLDLGDTLTS